MASIHISSSSLKVQQSHSWMTSTETTHKGTRAFTHYSDWELWRLSLCIIPDKKAFKNISKRNFILLKCIVLSQKTNVWGNLNGNFLSLIWEKQTNIQENVTWEFPSLIYIIAEKKRRFTETLVGPFTHFSDRNYEDRFRHIISANMKKLTF